MAKEEVHTPRVPTSSALSALALQQPTCGNAKTDGLSVAKYQRVLLDKSKCCSSHSAPVSYTHLTLPTILLV
eukprot:4447933-Amphidinium_carterae.1